MAEIRFFPLDVDYKIKEGKSYVYLYGKTIEGKQICVVERAEPYFYAEGKGDLGGLRKEIEKITVEYKGKEIRVTGTEEVEKNHLNRKVRLIKVFTNVPKGKNIIRRKLEEKGLECFEYDVLYIFQYLKDKGIIPMALVRAEGEYREERSKVLVFQAEKLEQESSEMVAELRVLSFDIETYAKERAVIPEKNPVLMVAFYGMQKEKGEEKRGEEKRREEERRDEERKDKEKGEEEDRPFKKVITWKRFNTSLDYVEFVDSEESLIKRFKEVVEKYKPDILTGYFSDGFDLPYLEKRAGVYGIELDLGKDYSGMLLKKRGESRARFVGLVHLDIFKFVRNVISRGMETESLSLEGVAGELLGYGKYKVNLDNLAKVWDSQPEELEEFCKYNLHDAYMTYELCVKLMPNMLEMVKLIGLPLFETTRMGFSRLVESYILRRCEEFKVVGANKPNYREVERRRGRTYEGGFVFEPAPGIYENLVVFDFKSLYPSIITAHNIGPETLGCECCSGEEKVPGESYWFCKKKKGFLPAIVEDLILRRTRIKEMIKIKKEKKEESALLEARSYGLKTVANAFYGYMGFFAARWYCLECVRSITAYARDYIKKTMEKAGERGFKVIYGDSLPPERKVFILTPNKEIKLLSIGSFVEEHLDDKEISKYKTLAWQGEKLIFSPLKKVIRHSYNSKEKGNLLEFITRYGKTKVTPQHSVYSYGLREDKIGLKEAGLLKEGDCLVSLTEVPTVEKYKVGDVFDLNKLNFGELEKEISFYADNYQFSSKKAICPYCKKKRALVGHVYREHQDRKTAKEASLGENFRWVGIKNAGGGRIPRYWELTEELAWILGYYCAEGSVSNCQTKTGRKCLLSFGSQELNQIKRVKAFFDKLLGENLRIIISLDKRIDKKMYYYRVQRIPIVSLFQFGFGCGKGSRGKKVPDFILSSEEKIRRAFISGYLAGDGTQKAERRYRTHFIQCDTNSQELACGLQFLFKSLKHGQTYYGSDIKHVGWKYRKEKENVLTLRVQSVKNQKNGLSFCPALIKKIKEYEHSGFVYDLEVEGAHNFVDAEGLILVHNTDSLMIDLGNKTKEEALVFMKEVNEALPEFMELELEGFYPRGIFVPVKSGGYGAKKKYALFDGEKIKVVGFEAVRRNWSKVAKETQDKVLGIILRENKTEKALEYVQKVVEEIRRGEVELEKVIIKTQLTKPIEQYESIGPHVAIARRMGEKGYEIVPGMVISFIVGKGKGLVREKAKMVEEVGEGEYDAEYYVKSQIIPAVSSIFAVLGYKEGDILKEKEQKGLGEFC